MSKLEKTKTLIDFIKFFLEFIDTKNKLTSLFYKGGNLQITTLIRQAQKGDNLFPKNYVIILGKSNKGITKRISRRERIEPRKYAAVKEAKSLCKLWGKYYNREKTI